MWKIIKNILTENKKLNKNIISENYNSYVINKIFSYDYKYIKISEIVNSRIFENIPDYMKYDFYFHLILKNKYNRINYLKKINNEEDKMLMKFFNVSENTLKIIKKNLKKSEIDVIINYMKQRRMR